MQLTYDSFVEPTVKILMWDARVDDALIEVKVQDGEATLSGNVGSAYERRVAQGDAWTQGVRSVDTSDLNIE